MYPMTKKDLGWFQIIGNNRNAILVSDPCYDRDPFVTAVIRNVKRGYWLCALYEMDGLPCGRRNALLVAHHSSYKLPEDIEDCHVTSDFMFGVDSGRAGIFDDALYAEEEKVDGEYAGQHLLPHEVWCESGIGDGYYRGFYDLGRGNQVSCVILDFGMREFRDELLEEAKWNSVM